MWTDNTQRAPVLAYVALGANLGDAAHAVRAAIDALDRLPSTRLVSTSSLYLTSPIDSVGPDYVNAVVKISTCLGAMQLLDQLQKTEKNAGRERPYRNAPRTLDLDILLYGESSMQGPALTVPHPRMAQRAFVLFPLLEIEPNLVSPGQLAAVSDQKLIRLPG